MRIERRAIMVEGIVQGVGFRPFVFALATRLGLAGLVRNEGGSVHIEVEGEAVELELLLAGLRRDAPPLARIEGISWEPLAVRGERDFHIVQSEAGGGGGVSGAVTISPDVATCTDCLRELFDPADRRHGYPFLNCTNCGPRLTIVTGAPYDRQRTTMATFAMCEQCRSEYENPQDRRFHAQPTACAVCGPRLQLLDEKGKSVSCNDPVAFFVKAMREGKVGAVKGLGGFHLVCDAGNEAAVRKLRQRKVREEKPFAVMAADAAAAEELCVVSAVEKKLLESRQRPVVLLRKRAGIKMAEEVAPGNPFLGVMLPYTPLHHLLLRAMGGALVMTSGNRSDEPIATENAEAVEKLAGIADLFLVHDRPIQVRCDDSVVRAGAVVRRSRGIAPEPLMMPMSCAVSLLAVGGQMKGTFGLGSGNRAILSHHLGDLDHLAAYRAFERDIGLYEQLFALRPKVIAHDLHPDYASTRYAKRRAAAEGIPCIAVQHHHAHMASCMAEHGLNEKVIGVCFDGTGYGTDGAIWGGEFLVGDFNGFERAAHLRYVGMPGGEQAPRHPWRMAAAHLIDAQANCESFDKRINALELKTIRRMIERRVNCPQTSSMGRLFDAVASLAGVRDSVHYEGQAAMELEWQAATAAEEGGYEFGRETVGGTIEVDARPVIRAVVRDLLANLAMARIAHRFHSGLAEMIANVCIELRKKYGMGTVVLSGGVFMNSLLSNQAMVLLERSGFQVYSQQKVPCNDGGLSLGQLAVAAASQQRRL